MFLRSCSPQSKPAAIKNPCVAATCYFWPLSVSKLCAGGHSFLCSQIPPGNPPHFPRWPLRHPLHLLILTWTCTLFHAFCRDIWKVWGLNLFFPVSYFLPLFLFIVFVCPALISLTCFLSTFLSLLKSVCFHVFLPVCHVCVHSNVSCVFSLLFPVILDFCHSPF